MLWLWWGQDGLNNGEGGCIKATLPLHHHLHPLPCNIIAYFGHKETIREAHRWPQQNVILCNWHLVAQLLGLFKTKHIMTSSQIKLKFQCKRFYGGRVFIFISGHLASYLQITMIFKKHQIYNLISVVGRSSQTRGGEWNIMTSIVLRCADG